MKSKLQLEARERMDNEWFTINVQRHHIIEGIKNDCMDCPIALALREEMCGKHLVAQVMGAEEVTLRTKMDTDIVWSDINVHEDDKDEIDRFIHDFDGGWLDHHSVDINTRCFSFRCQLKEKEGV